MTHLKSPITYYGGKGMLIPHLLKLVPYGRVYCEPFCGAATLFFARKPSPVEVLNDINDEIISLFRVLQDPDKFARFYFKVMLTPYSRKMWEWATSTLEETEDEVEKAYKIFIKYRQSFAGKGDSWGYDVTASNGGTARRVCIYLSILSQLPDMAARLMHAQIECGDYEEVVRRYDTPETVMYCDPPYVLSAINDPQTLQKVYNGQVMSEKDHERFLKWAVNAKSAVVISNYPNELYDEYLKGWQRIEIKTVSHAAGAVRHSNLQGKGAKKQHQPRTEVIWRNKRCLELERRSGVQNVALRFNEDGEGLY